MISEPNQTAQLFLSFLLRLQKFCLSTSYCCSTKRILHQLRFNLILHGSILIHITEFQTQILVHVDMRPHHLDVDRTWFINWTLNIVEIRHCFIRWCHVQLLHEMFSDCKDESCDAETVEYAQLQPYQYLHSKNLWTIYCWRCLQFSASLWSISKVSCPSRVNTLWRRPDSDSSMGNWPLHSMLGKQHSLMNSVFSCHVCKYTSAIIQKLWHSMSGPAHNLSNSNIDYNVNHFRDNLQNHASHHHQVLIQQN